MIRQMHRTAKVEYIADRQDRHLLSLMFGRAQSSEYQAKPNRNTRQSGAITLMVPKPRTNRLVKAPICRVVGCGMSYREALERPVH